MSGIEVPFADAFSGFLCNFANNCDVTVGASAYQCGGRSNQRWLHSNKWHDLPAPADRVSQRSWCFPADKQIARAKNNKHDDELRRRRSRGAFRPACRKQSLTCQHLMPQAASFVHRKQTTYGCVAVRENVQCASGMKHGACVCLPGESVINRPLHDAGGADCRWEFEAMMG